MALMLNRIRPFILTLIQIRIRILCSVHIRLQQEMFSILSLSTEKNMFVPLIYNEYNEWDHFDEF